MNDGPTRTVTRPIDILIGIFAVGVSFSVLIGIVLVAVGVHYDTWWLAGAGMGLIILWAVYVGVVVVVTDLDRVRKQQRSRERATAGREVQLVTLAQLCVDLAPASRSGWLVLDADSLTFTPDPDLPPIVPSASGQPPAAFRAGALPIPRGAIVKIASEVVRKAYLRILRVHWTDPSTGQWTVTEFLTMNRHEPWIAASPDQPGLSAATPAAPLPRAIVHFHEPAAGDAVTASPVTDLRS